MISRCEPKLLKLKCSHNYIIKSTSEEHACLTLPSFHVVNIYNNVVDIVD